MIKTQRGTFVTAYSLVAVWSIGGLTDSTFGQIPTHEYRESDRSVVKFAVEQADKYLQVVTFVKMNDGSVQRAKMLVSHPHHTSIGMRWIEKDIGTFRVTSQNLPRIYLPVGEGIQSYLFLLRKPTLDQFNKRVGYSEWRLCEVAVEAVSRDRVVRLPSLEELADLSKKESKLLAKLCSEFEKAREEEIAKSKEVVTENTAVPWWGKDEKR